MRDRVPEARPTMKFSTSYYIEISKAFVSFNISLEQVRATKQRRSITGTQPHPPSSDIPLNRAKIELIS
jgi:hypothetical protein